MGGVAGLVLHLHAQAADVHIHDLYVAEVVLAPDPFQDLFAHQRSARVAKEQLHDLELHLRQLNGLTGLQQHAAVLVQHELAAGQRAQWGVPVAVLLLGADHPAAQRLHTRQQLADAEGLGHVIVCADGQTADFILLLPLGTEDDDADLLVGAADGLAQREPVHARQHHVQNSGITAGLLCQQRQSGFGAFGLHHLHPRMAQVQGDHIADIGFIFYNKHSYHAASSIP